MKIATIQHVQQQTDTDCGLACLSMVSGLSMPDLAERYDARLGMSKREMCDALRELGIQHQISLYNELNFGHAYIATVTSLNKRGAMHFVVIDMRKNGKDWNYDLYDPLKGRDGKQWYRDLYDVPTWADLIKVVPKVVQA